MTYALAVSNKFLAPLPGKVRFGVWIDILVKEKFPNLSKIFFFFFLFLFVSYLYFVYFIFSFVLYFSFRFLA